MKNSKLSWCLVALLLAGLLTTQPATAQKNDKAEVLLQAAQHKQLVEGDLKAAIKIYNQIVAGYGNNRAVAAKALVQIGRCYEKMGNAEARKAYDRVLRDYGDQREMVEEARARLSALNPTVGNAAAKKATPGPTIRQVWAGPDMDWNTDGAPSPDGRYLSFGSSPSGDVAIRDLITGEIRHITNDKQREADEIIWSPDGKQLGYSVWTPGGKDEIEELLVVGLDGSKPRVLYHNEDTKGIWLSGWSPDGKDILAVFGQRDHTRQLVRVAISDGSVQVIKKLEGPLVKPRLSPDGRYLVYDVAVQKDSSRRDIFLLSADGSREIPLIQHPADDRVLRWAPDGKTILFISDRSGTWDAWIVSVVEGKVQGSPEQIKRDIGQVRPIGFTRSGSFYYSARTLLKDIYLATLDPETAKLIGSPTLAKTRYTGSNGGPDWSPDGRRLVYSSFSGKSPIDPSGDHQIFILNPETGEEREVRSKLKRHNSPRWFADGRYLLVRDWAGPGGLFKIDSETGDATFFAPEKPGSELLQPVLSRDGKALFYQNKSTLWKRNLETGEDKEIYRATPPTERPAFTESIALSPDSQRLAFLLRQSLFVVPATGGEARELLKLQEPEAFEPDGGNVAWTPDGRYLLFVKRSALPVGQWATRGKQPELWRIPADGGEPQKLGQLAAGAVSGLRVHPDGQRIAFGVQHWDKGEIWVMENFLPMAQPRKASASRR
jgi:Tol biopolymer transport system component